ncbi:MAG: ABC transporter ATP-binding protein [Clostridia bacterium]|nr:ABC transporter ATP-binding protein [Clostridia bacterium]
MTFREHIAITKRSIRMLWDYDSTYFASMTVRTILSGVMPYIPIYFSAKLIDALAAGESIGVLVLYVGLTVGLVFLMNLVSTWLSTVESTHMMYLYRERNWQESDKIMSMAYASIEDRETSLLRERINMESQTGYNLYYLRYGIELFLYHITQILSSVSMTISLFLLPSLPLWWKLVLFGCIVLNIVCKGLTTAKNNAIEQETMEDCVDANIFAGKYYEYTEDYSAGKDIRLYGMGEMLAGSCAEMDKELYEKFIRSANRQTLIGIPAVLLHGLLQFTAYTILIFGVLEGAVSVGNIARYVSCILMLLGAFSGIISNVQLLAHNNTYLARYFSYFDIPNNMYKGSLTVEKRDDREYTVELRDVSFKYPNTDAWALRHVNLKFRVGEKLAVVGMNGSGKTTFIKLLCRLYDPTEGEILLNGVNIQKYDYDEYMSIFSVVFQDFRLFAFSLGQNVAASREYDPALAEKCLRDAGFGDRLDTLADGLETCLYKNYSASGIEISGGEAQKIALARALYKNAPFIVLDEPTAALDPVAEYEVYSKFNEIVGDRTAVYISHRLASCRFCDNLVVFDHGSVVQHGSHEMLIADTAGKYHELWHAQAQYYEK